MGTHVKCMPCGAMDGIIMYTNQCCKLKIRNEFIDPSVRSVSFHPHWSMMTNAPPAGLLILVPATRIRRWLQSQSSIP